jgi:glycosyltransferase involved in cell wall biosynthesis
MRILHVTDTYLPRRGGIELHVHDLTHMQRRAGHHVDILTLTRPRDLIGTYPAGQVVRPADGSTLVDKARFIRAHRRLGEIDGYDVVHAHCSTMSPLVFATLAAAQVPTAVTVHSLWRRYVPLYRAGDALARWSRWSVAWSAVSRASADAVRRSAARPLVVDIVPNGIDLAAWGGTPRDRTPGRVRVMSVMRLAPRKRPLALLRILRHAAARLPRGALLEATVIGDGPEAPAMRRYIRRHRLDDIVTMCGHLPRPEIARRLTDADVFLAPSTLESFGIAALEAAASGVPVLGRRETGLAEFVRDGDGGLLVDSDAELSAALAQLAASSLELRPASAERLIQLDWQSVMDRTNALYARAGFAGAELQATSARSWSHRASHDRLPRRLIDDRGIRGGSKRFSPWSATRSTGSCKARPMGNGRPRCSTDGR